MTCVTHFGGASLGRKEPLNKSEIPQTEFIQLQSLNQKVAAKTMRNIRNISLKARILLIIGAVFLLNLAGQGLLQIYNWKQAIRSEIDASFSLAERLAGINLPAAEAALTDAAGGSIIGVLQGLRHINIIVQPDSADRFIDKAGPLKEIRAPGWFVRFLYPYAAPLPRLRIAGSDHFPAIVIEADPGDEIKEAWGNFRARMIGAFIFLCLVIMLIYTGFYIGLRPLDELPRSFEKLAAGSFDLKLNEHMAPELSRINRKFNELVAVLRRASQDNSLLARKMAHLQETERRALARELHDEMAPCLFGIRAAACRINAMLGDNKIRQAENELVAMDNMAGGLQQQMRAMLGRLRPVILDDLTIKQALMALLESREARQPPLKWEMNLTELNEDNLNDTIKLALYRIIQEGVTNIIRHADAGNARLCVSVRRADRAAMPKGLEGKPAVEMLHISIEDDGKGIPAGKSHGFGLTGMRERVEALGGRFVLSAPIMGGLKINADIPLPK